MGTRDRHTVARDRLEWRGIILDFRASEEKQDKTEEEEGEAFKMLTLFMGNIHVLCYQQRKQPYSSHRKVKLKSSYA
jgi:hypothetical protein